MNVIKRILQIFSLSTPLLAVGLTQFSVLTVGLVSSEQVYAQDGCTGSDKMGCVSWRKNQEWEGIAGQGADVQLNFSKFRFPATSTDYPIMSDWLNPPLKSEKSIYLRAGYIGTGNPTSIGSISFGVSASDQLMWDSAHNGYKIRERAGMTADQKKLIQNIVFYFRAGVGNANTDLGRNTSSISTNDIPSKNQSRTHFIYMTARVKVLGGIDTTATSIPIPQTRLFEVTYNGTTGVKNIGSLSIAGTSQPFEPPPPPKPKTCDTYAGGNFLFNFGDVSLDVFRASNEYGNLTQTKTITCPQSVPLKAKFKDSAPGQSASTANYLKNTGGATGIDARLYLTTPKNPTAQLVQMNTEYVIRDAVASNTNKQPVNFTLGAKLINNAGNNPGLNSVEANGTMILSYD